MTDLTTYEPQSTAVEVNRSLGGIANFEEYLRLATAICKTEMVPTTLRNKPEACLAVMMYGAELNIGPMQSLQQINFIAGKPSMAAELTRALVMDAGHKFIVKGDDKVATAVCRRKDWDADEIVTFTIEEAKTAGLLGNKNWTNYRKDMLIARVTTRACRYFFADVIAGMSYTPEEIESFTEPAPRQEQKRQVQAAVSRPSPLGEPEPGEEPFPDDADIEDAEVVEEAPAAPAPEANGIITEPQKRKIAVMLKNLGVPTAPRITHLNFIDRVLNLTDPLTSVTALSKAEAHALIDALEGMEEAGITYAAWFESERLPGFPAVTDDGEILDGDVMPNTAPVREDYDDSPFA